MSEITVSSRRFLTYEILLFVAVFILGYAVGTRLESTRVKAAMLVARQEVIKENPVLELVITGQPFCYSQGNIYPAKIIPRKNRSLMPWFKTVRLDEF